MYEPTTHYTRYENEDYAYEDEILESPAPWALARRFLFWFVLVYFVLYTFPFPISSLPTWGAWKARLEVPELPEQVEAALTRWDEGLAWVGETTREGWDGAVVWTADQLESVTITARPRGSGDTTFNYVQDGLRLCAALVIGVALCLAARRRTPPRVLRFALCVGVRYYLALYMLTYGFVKVIKSQFPFPRLERLLQPYGESSPMGLVWTFMGASEPYNWFAGGCEVLGGLLLLFRRTTTLGALVSVGVMANVTMLNFAYDVPVKLFSSHLLLMALALVVADLPRLVRFFLLNRQTEPQDQSAPYSNVVLRILGWGLKLTIIVGAIWGNVQGAWRSHELMDAAERPDLYGIWDVQRFEYEGVDLPPLATDARRWKWFIVDKPAFNGNQYVTLHSMSDERELKLLELEAYEDGRGGGGETMRLKSLSGTSLDAVLQLERPSEGAIVLRGELGGRAVAVELTRRLPEDFLLVSRGFRWINETPFNR